MQLILTKNLCLNFTIFEQMYKNYKMDIEKKCSYLDQFKILKTLGAGYHAQVKLGVDENGRYVAIKRYKKETATLNTLKHELNIMKNLDCENLVKLIDVRENATYKSRHEITYQCFAIVLEYVGGGELFDYIADTGKFSEKVSRTYFHQLMSGLYYMHGKGYAHRDIKPQNILLSHQFILKLADFGFSALIKGKDNSGFLHTKLGTQGYMAPEIPSKNYEGTKVDIFASGVILFIMYAGNPPFEKATANDPYYKLIKDKNYGVFWNAHSRRRPTNFFNDKFKDLFVRMVAFQSSERITVQQISQHPWMKEPISSYNQIKEEFTARQQKLDVIVNDRRQQEEKKKEQRMNGLGSQGHQNRGDTTVDEQFEELYVEEQQNKRQFPYLKFLSKDDFAIKEEVPYFISSLKDFFKNKKIAIQDQNGEQLGSQDPLTLKVQCVKDTENKILVRYEYKYGHDNEQFKQSVQILISLGKNQNLKGSILLNLQRVSGNQLYYKKIVRQIKNKFAYCLTQ